VRRHCDEWNQFARSRITSDRSLHTHRTVPTATAPSTRRPTSTTARSARDLFHELLAGADIAVNGSRPWDIQVHDERLWNRILSEGSIAVGESYMDGWWDAVALDQFLARAIRSAVDNRLPTIGEVLLAIKARLINMQTKRRAETVGRVHYDAGDDLYARMLDRRMLYSCAYWKNAADLDVAQEAKVDLVCRKLGLEPGMRVLDIGCGWGGAAAYAAEKYGVRVTGVTISRNQASAARERCIGLPIDIRFEDYRDITGTFDRIYSIGMFEHVGVRNHRAFLSTVRRLLVPDGLLLLHTIGNRVSLKANDPWIEKYIFPNGLIPSRAQISLAAERQMVIEDWHDFGDDYDRTLMAWHGNFERAYPDLAGQYDERFRRMWRFYLLVSAASFRARRSQLWQIVMSPEGVEGSYAPVR
jgi:cyclopropane-fatty-acyl-phospholipid synthase